MELREGYKRTEVGVIPEDWNAIPLGQNISGLNAGISVNSVDEEFDAFGHSESVLKTSCISRGCFYPKECKKILAKDIGRAKLNPVKDSIIISRMNTPALVGECGYVDFNYPSLYLPDRLWQIVFKKNATINVKWLSYVLSFGQYSKAIKDTATGTSGSMKNIVKGALLDIKIPFPQETEQTAIANALSDADTWIQSITRLIAKKRQIKQGAMQTLLNPYENGRLKAGWVVKKLGEVFYYQNGTSLESFFNNSSGLEVISIGNYSPSGKFVVTGSYISRSFTKEVERFILKKNELTMILNDKTAVGTIIGRVLLIDKNNHYVFNQRTMRLSCKLDILPLFAFHLINSDLVHRKIVLSAKPGTQIYVNTDDVLTLKLALPLVDEQIHIATILSNIDNEITALEIKLTKARTIKQGMMQNLLTGRIRLI